VHTPPVPEAATNNDVIDIFGFDSIEGPLSHFFELFLRYAGSLARGSSVDNINLRLKFNSIEHNTTGKNPLHSFIEALKLFDTKLRKTSPAACPPLPEAYPLDLLQDVFINFHDLPLSQQRIYTRYLRGSHIIPKMREALDKIRDILMLQEDDHNGDHVHYSLREETIQGIVDAIKHVLPLHFDTSLRQETAYYRNHRIELRLDLSSANLVARMLHCAADVVQKPLCLIMSEIFNRPLTVVHCDHALTIGSERLIPFLQQALGLPNQCFPSLNVMDSSQTFALKLEREISTMHRKRLACILVKQLIEAISEHATSFAARAGDTPAASLWQLIEGDHEHTWNTERSYPLDAPTLENQKNALLLELTKQYPAMPLPSDGKMRTLRLLQCSAYIESFFCPLSLTTALTYLRLLAMGIVIAASVFDYFLTEPNPTGDHIFEGAFALVILVTNAIHFGITARSGLMALGGEPAGCRFLRSPILAFAGLAALTVAEGRLSMYFRQLAENTYDQNADGQHQSELNTFAIYAWSLAQYAFLALAVETGIKLLSIFAGIATYCPNPRRCFPRVLSGNANFNEPHVAIEIPTVSRSEALDEPGSPPRPTPPLFLMPPGTDPRALTESPEQRLTGGPSAFFDGTVINPRGSDADSYVSGVPKYTI
jgi:hypothetical protein